MRLALFIVGLFLGAGFSRGCSARADAEPYRIEVNDAGYARLILPPLPRCLCWENYHADEPRYCRCQTPDGGWVTVRP